MKVEFPGIATAAQTQSTDHTDSELLSKTKFLSFINTKVFVWNCKDQAEAFWQLVQVLSLILDPRYNYTRKRDKHFLDSLISRVVSHETENIAYKLNSCQYNLR